MPSNVSRIDVSAESDITVVAGMARSGKSAWVKRQVARRPAVFAWDPDGEYILAGITRPIYRRVDLLRAVLDKRPGRFSYVAPISRAEFNFWALAVLHRGDCTAVAEETADVTHAGKAPEQWGQLVRKGAKRGISIFAVTQTPPESDKTVMRNARRIVCFMQDREPDIDYMAREMRVPRAEIAALAKLEALIVDKHAPPGVPRVTRFRHQFPAPKPAKIPLREPLTQL